jgi:hypothetical protein
LSTFNKSSALKAHTIKKSILLHHYRGGFLGGVRVQRNHRRGHETVRSLHWPSNRAPLLARDLWRSNNRAAHQVGGPLPMILLAHRPTRDFFDIPGVSPAERASATVPLFFSRWITHFCAALFSLRTAMGATSLVRGLEARAAAMWLSYFLTS